jgi:lipid-binding SYLF domain-containing protein
MNAEILTYSRAKGIFAGLTLNGAVISRDKDAMRDMYGSDVTTQSVLAGEVKAPPAAHEFLAAVRKADDQARASG